MYFFTYSLLFLSGWTLRKKSFTFDENCGEMKDRWSCISWKFLVKEKSTWDVSLPRVFAVHISWVLRLCMKCRCEDTCVWHWEKKQSKRSQWGWGLVPPLAEARVCGWSWKPVGGHCLMGWWQCHWHGWHTPPSCPDMSSGGFIEGNAFRLLKHFWKTVVLMSAVKIHYCCCMRAINFGLQ